MTYRHIKKALLPIQAKDFVVRVGGRERPWLSRMLGVIVAPFFRWQQKRRLRRDNEGERAA
jgi:hypothetical protein